MLFYFKRCISPVHYAFIFHSVTWCKNKSRPVGSPYYCLCSGHMLIASSALVPISFLTLAIELHFVFKRMVKILMSALTNFPFSLSAAKVSLNSLNIGSNISFSLEPNPSASSKFSSSANSSFITYSSRF